MRLFAASAAPPTLEPTGPLNGPTSTCVPQSIMNGQPYCFNIGRSPVHSMFRVRRDIRKVPFFQPQRSLAFKRQNGLSLQYHDPFVLLLVIPIRFRSPVPLRYNALYSNPPAFNERLKTLICQIVRNCFEQVLHPVQCSCRQPSGGFRAVEGAGTAGDP